MNFAEKAKQLRDERLEHERLANEQKAKEQAEAAEKRRQMLDLVKKKAEEVLALLRQFDGFKICDGRVSLKTEVKSEQGLTGAFLKTDSVGLSAMDRYTPNMHVLSVHFHPESGTYYLQRYQLQVGGRPSMTNVGNYKTADELMNAVTAEVSKL